MLTPRTLSLPHLKLTPRSLRLRNVSCVTVRDRGGTHAGTAWTREPANSAVNESVDNMLKEDVVYNWVLEAVGVVVVIDVRR